MLKSKHTLWLLLAVALYSVGHLTWYLDTPLGQSPVLDGQENRQLAQQISESTLAEEPFYRAMLYPFVLAYWPAHWAILGLIAHLGNTYLSYRLSLSIWKHTGGAILSGTLVGLNPILLHYAFDPLDTILATSFFLLGLNFIPEALSPSRFADRWLSSSLVGLFFGIACLARPHFFAVLIPIILISLYAWLSKRVEWQRSILFIFFAAIPIVIYGLVQVSVSGQFRVLPWQGAYNLWTSNNDKANGLYFTQSLEFHYLDEHKNPNRLEDETLYQQETGSEGSIDERTSYWRKKTFDHILDKPIDWLGLMAFKSYALINNYEQYNNKTYSFHRSLSPWLRYNPICWGLLLILAAASVSTLWKQSQHELLPLLVIIGTFSAGVLIYMASGRFRVPLIPILAVFAGGLPYAYKAFKVSSSATKRKPIIAAVIAAALSFSFLFGVNDKDTYIQDELLLADASAELGLNEQAIAWANAVLERSSDRQSARRIRMISRYNLAAIGQTIPDRAFWQELANDAYQLEIEDPAILFTKGLIEWNLGENKIQAFKIWHEAHANYQLQASSSLAALLLCEPSNFEMDLTNDLKTKLVNESHPLLCYAIASKMNATARTKFLEEVQLSQEAFNAIGESFERVIGTE